MQNSLTFIENCEIINYIIMKKNSIAICALFCTVIAYGSGFQTLEQGAANMGNANAGATVNSNADASSAFWNPSAGFNTGLKVGETKLDVVANMVISSFDFTGGFAGTPPTKSGDAGTVSVVPNFFIIHQLKEDILLSMSITAPYALETDYGNDWVGNMFALKSNITTFDFNPSISFKLNEYITFGGGVSAQWLHGELSQMSAYGEADVTGASWGVGGNIGFTVNYAEDGRVGFHWRSEVSHTAKGNQHLNGNIVAPVELDLTTPHTFNIGWYQRLRGDLKKFAIMAEYSYTMWSVFEDLTISYRDHNGILTSYSEDWRNTSRIAVGMHFYPLDNDDLVVRLGTAWDQTPIKDAEHRYARIPCTDRIWFSAGLGYKWNNFNFDLGYTYIYFYDKPKMNEKNPATGATIFSGYFEGNAHVVSAQIGYKF